jgi:hypothetical protein
MRRFEPLLVAAALAVAILAGSARPALAVSTVRILGGLSGPTFVAAPLGDDRLFVVERAGRVLIYDGVELLDPPFLEIPGVGTLGEGGLLGLAFPEDFDQSQVFYVYYTASSGGGLESRVAKYAVSAMDPDLADPAPVEVLASFPQPRNNHNGGTIAIRGDHLYLGLGDGGGGGDPDDVAQDPASPFGKMLRYDISGEMAGPAETWASGLRNPFRFSFDRDSGDLYIADVGQDALEEVNAEAFDDPGGRNYGWDVKEGSSCFVDNDLGDPTEPDEQEPECTSPSLTDPIHQYAHVGGLCSGSITGGYVYRGAIPEIHGLYFFADFCTAQLWSLEWDGAGGVVGDVVNRTAELAPGGGLSIDQVVGFGEDGQGELYIVDIGGEIFQLVPEPGRGLLHACALICLAGGWRARGRRAPRR